MRTQKQTLLVTLSPACEIDTEGTSSESCQMLITVLHSVLNRYLMLLTSVRNRDQGLVDKLLMFVVLIAMKYVNCT